MTRARQIEEAARAARLELEYQRDAWARRNSDGLSDRAQVALDALDAALAQTPDGGEVAAVERAAEMLVASKGKTPLGQANALHAAGLLAGKVDRDALADKLYLMFSTDPSYADWVFVPEETKERWRRHADEILREVGR